MIGILRNILIAGMSRQPAAFGIHLVYQGTIVEGKVMKVLRLVEEAYPRAGAAMIDTVFPGKSRPREELLWEYAGRRAEAWEKNNLSQKLDATNGAWPMPPLLSPLGKGNDSDIPISGPYSMSNSKVMAPLIESDQNANAGSKDKSGGHVIELYR